MKNDPWLEKWLALIQKRSASGYVLELGCGAGWDTVDLLSAGCNVIATDISEENLAECAKSAPNAKLVQLDIGKPFPLTDHSLAVIIASLSLHYFSWAVTLQISSEIKSCIKDGGLLPTRFNSINDHNYGSSSTSEIEPNFYSIEGRIPRRLRREDQFRYGYPVRLRRGGSSYVGTNTKRFFDEISVRLFLQGWDIRFLQEIVIHRYQKPKCVWEAMAVRN
jgi:SAM-dependent methyltransferase